MTYDLVDAGGTDQFGWRFENGDMFWHDYVNNVDVIQYDRSEGAWIPADGGASLGTASDPWSSLTIEEANTTNQTYVEAYLDADITGVGAGDWSNILDTEVEDARGEFDSNQFTPDETGRYDLNAQARIADGSQGDTIQVRVRDIDNEEIIVTGSNFNAGSTDIVSVRTTRELTAGTKYEVQGRNLDSSFDIDSGQDQTFAEIRKDVVQP